MVCLCSMCLWLWIRPCRILHLFTLIKLIYEAYEDFLWRHFMYAAKWSPIDSCLTNIALVCTTVTLTWWDHNSKKKVQCATKHKLCIVPKWCASFHCDDEKLHTTHSQWVFRDHTVCSIIQTWTQVFENHQQPFQVVPETSICFHHWVVSWRYIN